jgi:magnesium transporter
MPELTWKYGYLLAMGTVASICGFLYYQFRKSGWL